MISKGTCPAGIVVVMAVWLANLLERQPEESDSGRCLIFTFKASTVNYRQQIIFTYGKSGAKLRCPIASDLDSTIINKTATQIGVDKICIGDMNTVPLDEDRRHANGIYGKNSYDDHPHALWRAAYANNMTDMFKHLHPGIAAASYFGALCLI